MGKVVLISGIVGLKNTNINNLTNFLKKIFQRSKLDYPS